MWERSAKVSLLDGNMEILLGQRGEAGDDASWYLYIYGYFLI